MSGIKFSNTTPAAPGGQSLVTFQADGNGNISAAYTPGGSGAQTPLGFDSHPSSPNAANDEFEATSLDSAWTVITNTAASVDYNTSIPGSAFIKYSGNQAYAIGKAFSPGSSDFSVTLKAAMPLASNYDTISLQVSDHNVDADASPTGVTCNAVHFDWNSGTNIFGSKWVSGTETDGVPFVPGSNGVLSTVYLHLQRVAGVWSAYYSLGQGDNFRLAPAPAGGYASPSVAFIVVTATRRGATAAQHASIDFVRVNQIFF